MITAVPKSGDSKTGPIAATYRAGPGMYGSCPTTCQLLPDQSKATDKIDWPYFKTLLKAKPPQGVSFMYTHFHFKRWAKTAKNQPTVVNYSADNWKQAAESMKAGVPTVLVVPPGGAKVQYYKGLRGVICPAIRNKTVQCINCGGGVPLCARPNRNYVVLFEAHGASKRRATSAERGGCYASGGNVRMHWQRLSEKPDTDDSEVLSSFVSRLPAGSILRHHIAGDIGKWGYT